MNMAVAKRPRGVRLRRRRHRLFAQGRVPDRYRRDRPRPRRRAFADFGFDRTLHRAPDAEPSRTPARAAARYRKTDAARNRYPVGHRQRLQLCRDRRPSWIIAPDRAGPHQEHLPQARSPHPRRGGVRGAAAGLDPAVMAIAAKPGFSSRRLRASRLTQYALVQVLIVIVCIFVLHQSLPQPPSRYLVTEFNAKEGGTERAVTLPHYTSSRFSMSDPPLYTGDFAWPGSSEPNSEAQHAWSVFLPRFNNGVGVAVNCVVILDSRRDPPANLPDPTPPDIALIPA